MHLQLINCMLLIKRPFKWPKVYAPYGITAQSSGPTRSALTNKIKKMNVSRESLIFYLIHILLFLFRLGIMRIIIIIII